MIYKHFDDPSEGDTDEMNLLAFKEKVSPMVINDIGAKSDRGGKR